MHQAEQDQFSAKANLLVKGMQGLKPGISPKQANNPKRAQTNPKQSPNRLGQNTGSTRENRRKKRRGEGTYGA